MKGRVVHQSVLTPSETAQIQFSSACFCHFLPIYSCFNIIFDHVWSVLWSWSGQRRRANIISECLTNTAIERNKSRNETPALSLSLSLSMKSWFTDKNKCSAFIQTTLTPLTISIIQGDFGRVSSLSLSAIQSSQSLPRYDRADTQ